MCHLFRGGPWEYSWRRGSETGQRMEEGWSCLWCWREGLEECSGRWEFVEGSHRDQPGSVLVLAVLVLWEVLGVVRTVVGIAGADLSLLPHTARLGLRAGVALLAGTCASCLEETRRVQVRVE